jgi:hypothetical protein
LSVTGELKLTGILPGELCRFRRNTKSRGELSIHDEITFNPRDQVKFGSEAGRVRLLRNLIRHFGALSAFIAAGIRDPIVPRDQTEQLAALLEAGGADVSMFWHRGGYELGDDDIAAAKTWLTETVIKRLAA